MRAGLAWLLAVTCAPNVAIQTRPSGRLDVEAKAAPVESILNCIAAQTGMKFVKEGPALPSQPLTVSLRDRTEVEVIDRLFEGLGLNYALSMDPSQSRVLMLLLSAPGGGGTPRNVGAPPASQSSPLARPPRDAPPIAEVPNPDLDEQPQQPLPLGPRGIVPALPGSMPPPGVVGVQPIPAPETPAPPETTPEPEPEELFPEQRPLTPLSLRDAGRAAVVALGARP